MTVGTSETGSSLRDALALLGAGNAAEAVRLCGQLLAADRNDARAATVLGQALLMLGRGDEAVRVYESLTASEPQKHGHWQNLGTALRATGRHDAALAAYKRAADTGAESADFLYNLGLLHLDRCDPEAAVAVLARAVARSPRDPAIRCAFADALHRRMRTDEAVDVLVDWESLPGIDTPLAARLAQLLLNLGEARAAERALARAISDPYPDPEATLTIVQVLERTNRVAQARAHLKRLPVGGSSEVEQQRLEIEALLAQREGDHLTACDRYRKALARIDALHLRHHQLFPLARSLDALADHEAAFATLREAHASQLAELARTAPDMVAHGAHTMGITRFGCDPEDVAQWRDARGPAVAESPVFVVGFPRSGTTLLEQAIDAHPALESMDEQPYLQFALDELLRRGVRYPDALAAASEADLSAARQRYFALVARRVELRPGQRLVDKNPLNLLRLPVIRRLFPAARIVMIVRHPCDVLLSCYMQHFRAPDFALLCADLERLATGHRRAMDFWRSQRELLEPAVLEVHYETLVARFEREMRGICEFLELDFDPAMLEPAQRARSRRFVSTPSYAQVVEPVNSRAVGRSQPYLGHFERALPIIAPCLEHWGYTLQNSR
jgi:tetratricopeptide (TPR) repeat protein